MTATLESGLRETNLSGLTPFARGKVRDLYAVGDDRLLVVATDRISAFDVVLPTAIPDKGKVLNQLSAFWFRRTGDIVPNHLLADDVGKYPEALRAHADTLAGRSMLVQRAHRIDIECVARGYISGSAWSEYRRQGTACGIQLPAGLIESQQLSEPIFTPAIKAATGHDENISFRARPATGSSWSKPRSSWAPTRSLCPRRRRAGWRPICGVNRDERRLLGNQFTRRL